MAEYSGGKGKSKSSTTKPSGKQLMAGMTAMAKSMNAKASTSTSGSGSGKGKQTKQRKGY